MRRDFLDEALFSAVQKSILAPDRLSELLKGVLELSDVKRQKLEQGLSHALAERTRRWTAIDRLPVLVEDGVMKASDPEFANRLAGHREMIAAITGRIEVIESRHARGSRKITPAVFEKFSQQVAEKLQDEDNAPRSAYLRMFASEVSVSDQGIQTSGSKSVLERGLAIGLPQLEGNVPIFDQKWCRLRDSNT